MTNPAHVAAALEATAVVPDVPGRERLRGYAVTGVPFRSGHLLAMRRFPATSIGPGYTSLWHRDPTGRLVIYQDQAPHLGCPRAFGPAVDETRIVPIRVKWPAPYDLVMDIDTGDEVLHWEMTLSVNPVTRLLNTLGRLLPVRLRRHPAVLAVAGRIAGPLLRAGRVRLTGAVPSGQTFAADLRGLWVIDQSTAVIDGEDLGEPGALPAQPHLGDFWLPQRGLFAFADGFFEPYDRNRHIQVASRAELAA